MFGKIKSSIKPYLPLLTDSRTLGIIAFGFVAILVSWSGVKAIQTNYELQKQIARMQQENDVKRLENDNQRLKNEYYKTDQFLELAARRQFGKAAEGERIYIVPKEVALANIVASKKAESKATEIKTSKSKAARNIEAWINFYLNRGD